jgi:hypothetical protein
VEDELSLVEEDREWGEETPVIEEVPAFSLMHLQDDC